MNPESLNELALFAGAGGGLLASRLLGWRTVCAVEINDYARRVLMQRQDDGHLEPFPIWDDVRTFDGRPWRGLVDIISGGFPCQDISLAGKGDGLEGARSGLWKEMRRIVREVRPAFVFVENSSALTSRGLGTVLGDLAKMGYDARWGVLGARHVGAPHWRDRIWIVAHSNSAGRQELDIPTEPERPGLDRRPCAEELPDAHGCRCEAGSGDAGSPPATRSPHRDDAQRRGECTWWRAEPTPAPVAHGVAARVDQLVASGNGQVPEVAVTAWGMLRPTSDDL